MVIKDLKIIIVNFEVDKYSSRIVKRIFKMRLEGMTPTMIARKLSDEKIRSTINI